MANARPYKTDKEAKLNRRDILKLGALAGETASVLAGESTARAQTDGPSAPYPDRGKALIMC